MRKLKKWYFWKMYIITHRLRWAIEVKSDQFYLKWVKSIGQTKDTKPHIGKIAAYSKISEEVLMAVNFDNPERTITMRL